MTYAGDLAPAPVAYDPGDIPRVTIRKITRVRLDATRPREVGQVHRATSSPQAALRWSVPANLVETDVGLRIVGWCRAPNRPDAPSDQMQQLIGKSLPDLFGDDGLVRRVEVAGCPGSVDLFLAHVHPQACCGFACQTAAVREAKSHQEATQSLSLTLD